jgi:hypothetical protein
MHTPETQPVETAGIPEGVISNNTSAIPDSLVAE